MVNFRNSSQLTIFPKIHIHVILDEVYVDACEGFQIQGFDIWPLHTYNTKNNGQLCRLLFSSSCLFMYMLLQVVVRYLFDVCYGVFVAIYF